MRADVTDEEGAVTRAILRLSASPAVRARLSAGARRFTSRAHAPLRMRDGYRAAIARALSHPAQAPRPEWPAHWRSA